MSQVDDCREGPSKTKYHHQQYKVCGMHSNPTPALVGKADAKVLLAVQPSSPTFKG